MRLPNDDPEEADRLSGKGGMDPYAALLHTTRVEAGKHRRQIARLENAIRLAHTLSTEARVQSVLEQALDQKGGPR